MVPPFFHHPRIDIMATSHRGALSLRALVSRRAPALPTALNTCLITGLLCGLIFAPVAASANEPEEVDVDQEVLPEEAETIEEELAIEGEPDNNGLHLQTALGLRYQPIGLRLDVIGGYRVDLFDSESILLKDAYVEGGVWTDISPSNFWVGPYVELLPVAVLKLWASVQSLSYYGTFGYLYEPEDPANPDWDLDTLSNFEIGDGTPAHGWMVDVRATPQAKVGNVVIQAETQLAYVDMDIDQNYYESSFDFVLEPEDTFWVTRPTLGWVFVGEDQWLLTGFRWEHGESVGTEITRDMAALLGLWKLPWKVVGGDAKLALVAGFWVNHPNREEEPLYLASQFSVDWAP